MDIRLIALDLDGTLCNSQRQVTERSMAALKAAAEQGVHIVPTTGRLFHAMPQELLRCGFVRYGICMNGGQIYDAAEDRILHRDEIPLDTAMRVYDYLEQFPVAYDCYVNNGAMMERAFWERLGEYIVGKPLDLAYSTKLRTPVEGFRARLLEMGVPLQKIQAFMSDVSIRPRMLRELQEGFPELSVSFSLAYNIEINSATATKGNALKKLCGHLGISAAQAAAFGDGTNDISMLQAAGYGVAMGNAVAEVKAAANYETASNDDDGVALFLEKYVLK